MKRLITFFVLSCFIASLSAQTMEHRMLSPDNRKAPDPDQMVNLPGYENTHHFYPLTAHKPVTDDFFKSSNVIKQKLDSNIFFVKDTDGNWEFYNKTENQYNESGNLTQQVQYIYQNTKDETEWVASFKTDYTYDLNDKLTGYINSLWNIATNQWEKNWKSEFFYNNDGNLAESKSYSWDKNSSQWIADWKEELNYDENGNLILYIDYDWDENTNQWVYSDKSVLAYDNDGNMVQIMGYYWDNGQWQNDYKTDFDYNNENYLTILTDSYWSGSQWEFDEKSEFSYDDQWNMIREMQYYWENGQWNKDQKYDYTFEDNGNLMSENTYNWNEDTQTWEDQHKEEYTYNNDYAFEDLVLPIIDIYGFDTWWEVQYNHMLLSMVYSLPEEAARQWVESYKSDLYYSEIDITSIPETAQGDFLIFPNPAVNEFGVRSLEFGVGGATIELYDLSGRKLLEKQIPKGSKETTVNVSNLQSGPYFCRIRTEKGSVTKKLIINN